LHRFSTGQAHSHVEGADEASEETDAEKHPVWSAILAIAAHGGLDDPDIGAASGIALAIAKAMADARAKVALLDSNEQDIVRYHFVGIEGAHCGSGEGANLWSGHVS
jgi:hypothetical protein